MKVKYVGETFYSGEGLTDGKIYECIGIEGEGKSLRIIDDSGEDYLYSAKVPAPMDPDEGPGGRWEIVEDDNNGTLKSILNN